MSNNLFSIFKKKSGKNMGVSVPAGIDVSATPSHQEAVALAYAAGEYVLPASWISPSYNEHDVSLPSQSGGKGGGKGGASSAQTQWKRYATVAMIWHVGVANRLTGLILDEALVWSGNIVRTPGTHYVDVAIEGRGIYRHYWGTQTQPDPLLIAAGNNYGDDHPSYEGVCYGILIDFLYGIDKEQAPAPRVRGERTPVQPFYSGAEAENNDGQANLIAVAAELLTDTRFGISFPTALCSVNAWRAAIIEASAHRANLCFCSPVIDDHQELRSFLADIIDLADAYLRPDPETGLLECGFFAQPEDIVPASLVTIEQADLLKPHSLSPGSWDDVKNTWNVTFRDRDYVMKENQVSAEDQRVLDIHQGEVRNEDIQAKAIVRRWQASQLAEHRKQREGLPPLEGTIVVPEELVDGIAAGDHIRTDIDLRAGGLSKQQVFRVTRIKRTWDGEAELTLVAERTLAPIVYNTPVVPRQPDPDKEDIPDVGVSRTFELPWRNYALGILAARTDGLQTGFAIHYDRVSTGTYQTLASSGGVGFALKARLISAIASDAGSVQLELLGSLEREIIKTDPGDVGARDDQVLLILVKTAGGQISADPDGFAFIEVLSCQAFVVDAPNQITATTLRGRMASTARPFAADTEAWLIRRADLPWIEHADFEELAQAAGTAYLKLQAVKLRDLRPLEDCAARAFTFALARPATSDRLRYLERRYQRTVSQPNPPVVAEPADWFVSAADAVGIGSLWMTEAYKYQDDNTLAGAWSVPVKVAEDPQLFEDFEAQLTQLQQDADQLALDLQAEATERGTSITQEHNAWTAGDQAEATARTLAIATVTDALTGKASTAALDQVQQALADSISAETLARQTAISQVNNALDGKASTAALIAESTTRADEDAAEITARTNAIGQVNDALAGKASTAALANEVAILVAADAAETSARETAISQVNNSLSEKASLAAVQQESATRATETSALASQYQAVASQIADVESSVTLQAQSFATLAGDAEARLGLNLVTRAGGKEVVTGVQFISKAGSNPKNEMRFAVGMDLVSEDYVPGVSGWIKKGNGDSEDANGLFRGRIQASKIGTDSTVFNPAYPNVDLPATSSHAAANQPVKLYGVGLKAQDATTAYNNWQYWLGEYNTRLAYYDQLYAEATEDAWWEDTDSDGIDDYYHDGIDGMEQDLLDAQMVLVNEANTNRLTWQNAYDATQIPVGRCFGRMLITFIVTCGVGFSASGGDMHPRYRVNGGAWVEFGDYLTVAGTNPNVVGTYPVTLTLQLTDIVEFYPNWSAPGKAGDRTDVSWSNQ